MLLISSCKQEYTSSTGLNGKWYWLSSSGGIAEITETPESLGIIQITEFEKDSVFRFYRNDTLKIEGSYHIKSNFGESGMLLLRYNGNSVEKSFSIKNQDTLILRIDLCFDCPISTFKRIK
jgi:hypothetical protein